MIFKVLLKIPLQFLAGCISAFLLGSALYVIRDLLASVGIIWKLFFFALDFRVFMFFITLVGLPTGSLFGIVLVDRFKFDADTYDKKKIFLGAVFSIGGIVLILWILPLADIDVITFMPLFSRMGYDAYVYWMPVIASLFASIGYNLKWPCRDVPS